MVVMFHDHLIVRFQAHRLSQRVHNIDLAFLKRKEINDVSVVLLIALPTVFSLLLPPACTG